MLVRYSLLAILLLAMAGVIYCDGGWRRIPNFITLPLMVIGLVAQGLMHGWLGMGYSVAGFLVGAGLFFPLYWLRGMGAGDLKLIAAIGAFLSLRLIFSVVFFTVLSGGVLGLAWLVLGRTKWHGQAVQALEEQPLAATLPYGWAIVSGTILTLCFHPAEVWL